MRESRSCRFGLASALGLAALVAFAPTSRAGSGAAPPRLERPTAREVAKKAAASVVSIELRRASHAAAPHPSYGLDLFGFSCAERVLEALAPTDGKLPPTPAGPVRPDETVEHVAGIVLDPSGLVLACARSFTKPGLLDVAVTLPDGTRWHATERGRDAATGLAVLAITGKPAGLAPARIRDARADETWGLSVAPEGSSVAPGTLVAMKSGEPRLSFVALDARSFEKAPLGTPIVGLDGAVLAAKGLARATDLTLAPRAALAPMTVATAPVLPAATLRTLAQKLQHGGTAEATSANASTKPASTMPASTKPASTSTTATPKKR